MHTLPAIPWRKPRVKAVAAHADSGRVNGPRIRGLGRRASREGLARLGPTAYGHFPSTHSALSTVDGIINFFDGCPCYPFRLSMVTAMAYISRSSGCNFWLRSKQRWFRGTIDNDNTNDNDNKVPLLGPQRCRFHRQATASAWPTSPSQGVAFAGRCCAR